MAFKLLGLMHVRDNNLMEIIKMKKVLILGLSVLTLNVLADESASNKTTDNNVAVIATGEGVGFGASANWKQKTVDEESETVKSSSIKLIPVGISYGNGEKGSGPKVHLDVGSNTSKKSFIGKGALSPYVHLKSSGPAYTYDGEQFSFQLGSAGGGLGLQLNLSDDVKLSAHAGLGLGIEFGKRSGVLDGSYYSQAQLELFDLVDIVAKDEIRKSLDGDREHLSQAQLGVRINDRIRAGLEYETSRNTFAKEGNYTTNYGGLFVSGRFGSSK